jgi:hypothetical protein
VIPSTFTSVLPVRSMPCVRTIVSNGCLAVHGAECRSRRPRLFPQKAEAEKGGSDNR